MLACGVLQPVQGMIEEMAIKIYTSVKSHCSVLLLCALLKTNFPAFAAAAENALDSTTFGPYVEVYPAPVDLSRNQLDCTPTNNETCPLYFALMMSFGGEYVSSGVIASVQYALDQINSDSDLLPGYSLHYTLTDSQCNRTVSLRAFHTQIINPPTKIAAIGSGCSIATEASAEISHFYNITQLSCVSSSAALANRVRYPSYFQLLAPDADLADGFLAIIKHFKWRRVALIVQEENLLTVTMDRLKQALAANDIKFSEKRFETEKGIESLGENPFDPEARIFIVAMYEFRAQHLMCKAYELGIHYPQKLFLFYGWYVDKWWVGITEDQREYLRIMYPGCTAEQRSRVVAYSLGPLQAEFLVDQDESTVINSGINGTQFQVEYDRYLHRSQFNLSENIYSQQCYDATWALAYALNDTLTECRERGEGEEGCSAGSFASNMFGLHHFQYNHSRVLRRIKRHLEETDFIGITGKIMFDRSTGARRVGRVVVLSYQPSDETEEFSINITRIGSIVMSDNESVKFNFINGKDIWGSAGVPHDGVPRNHLVSVKFPLAIFYVVLGVLGITFAVGCLCFNFACRKNPLIRLTSPNLNYLIGIGAIILYADISLSVAPTTDHRVVTILCNLAPWFNAIGYSLCFGTIVVKMFRVYYIFNNPMPTKKIAMHDWMLALIVLLLVGIDVLILTIFMMVESLKGRLQDSAVTVLDREKPMSTEGVLQIVNEFYTVVCKSKSRDIALAVLYGYKALLQIIAILFAFSIRKVKVKGLDDAKYIVTAVYVTSIVTAVIIVATYTLYDFSNALSAVLCSGIFIGATIILLLVFIPKMIALYKDPEGTSMFSKQQRANSSHSQPQSRSSFSLSVQKKLQSTDHSTSSEVESLKKRINELESRLASMQGVEYNRGTELCHSES